jgi:NADH dehydrogenase
LGTIVVTGAAGFVGRRLVQRLLARGDKVIAIGRRPAPAGVSAQAHWIVADLVDPATYETGLQGADCVVHLAAVTGKARRKDFQRNNVETTRALLSACERAGVGRFVLVSSIAAKFADRRFYPYAESKIAAEALARASSVPAAVVRPTMIMGEGSPIEAALGKLAHLPGAPLFGDGGVKVQPVDVEDVVSLLVGLAHAPEPVSGVIELGGPEVFTIRELLARLRSPGGDVRNAKFLVLPLGPIRGLLALLEGPLLPVLPLTAGQLASFANDGVAAPHPAVARLLTAGAALDSRPAGRTEPTREGADAPPPAAPGAQPAAKSSVDDNARELRSVDEASLSSEMQRHARYLIGVKPTPYQIERYLAFHRQRALAPRDRLDALLLDASRSGEWGLCLADAYAGLLYRKSTLRSKLVLALAILECAPPSFPKLDAPDRGGFLIVGAGLSLRVAATAATLLLSLVFFAPAHAWLACTGGLSKRRAALA